MNKYTTILIGLLLLTSGYFFYKSTQVAPITLIERHTDTLYIQGKDVVTYKTKKVTDTVYVRFSGNCDSCTVSVDTTVKKDSSSVRVHSLDLKDGLIVDMNIFEKYTLRVDTLKIKDSVVVIKPLPREWYDKPEVWVGIGAFTTYGIIKLLGK